MPLFVSLCFYISPFNNTWKGSLKFKKIAAVFLLKYIGNKMKRKLKTVKVQYSNAKNKLTEKLNFYWLDPHLYMICIDSSSSKILSVYLHIDTLSDMFKLFI